MGSDNGSGDMRFVVYMDMGSGWGGELRWCWAGGGASGKWVWGGGGVLRWGWDVRYRWVCEGGVLLMEWGWIQGSWLIYLIPGKAIIWVL